MTEFVELVRASTKLHPVHPFEPKNAPKGKGGFGDLPEVRLCPYAKEIRAAAKNLEVSFRSFDSKRCFCGVLTLENGERTPVAACIFLQAMTSTKLQELEASGARECERAKATNEAGDVRAEREYQGALAAYEKAQEKQRANFLNYWNLPPYEQAEVRANLRKNFPPPKKSQARRQKLPNLDVVSRGLRTCSCELNRITGVEPSYERLNCPLANRLTIR